MHPHPSDKLPPPEVAVPVYKELEFLPREVPKVPELEFTGPGDGWPPRPRGQRDVRQLAAAEIPGGLNDALEAEIRRAAVGDERVRALLGTRFVHLTTDMRQWGKGRRPDPTVPLETRLLFFSHTKNVAVEVRMAGLSVRGAAMRPGFQPPEVPEEIEQAVALARAHPHITDLVQDLEAGGLLLPFRDGDVGYRHRIIWVTFFDAGEREGEKPARFSAVVDLTDQRVLVARPEPPIGYPNDKTGGMNNA